jgi:glycosyltransferase involved in cell wall biosynthesis
VVDEKMISVVIPAHNEEKVIGTVLDELINVLEDQPYEIIVVDDGSTDNTAKIVQQKESVKLIQHPINKGYGAALKTGIKNATNDLIMIIDGDGTYPVKAIPELLEEVDKYDMVVGARTGKVVKIQLYRRPAKWLLSKLANYLVGTKIPDLNSGMRIFKKEAATKFFNILPSGFSFTTTITLAYLSNDYNVKYVPIDYHERTGKSKIKPFRDGSNFIMLIVRTITYFNPLKVFLPISIVLFVFGFVVLVYQAIVTRNVADLPVMLILAAFQIGFLGLVADLIVRKRRS